MRDGGGVDRQDAPGVLLAHPHRLGVVFKQQAVLLLGSLQLQQQILQPRIFGNGENQCRILVS